MARAAAKKVAPPLIYHPEDVARRLMGTVYPAAVISGPKSIGKATLARAWASSLMCQSGCLTGATFGTVCRTCRLILQEHHPDILRIGADEGTSVKVDQIRELQEQLAYRPVEAPYRFVLIERAETITDAAANCLLKTLEEPPEATLLVLQTTNHFRLLPTVLSRCRMVRLLPVERTRLQAWLEGQGIEAEKARQAAAAAEGVPGRALELIGSSGYWNLRQSVIQVLQNIGGGPVRVIESAAELDRLGGREKIMAVLDVCGTWWRDLMWLSLGQPESDVIHQDHLAALKKLAGTDAGRWLRAVSLITEARTQVQANVNMKLLLERLLLGIY